MTTRRNNMFHDRGFTGGINLALRAIKEYGDLDKVKDCLLKFKESRAKWITDCMPGFTTSTLESRSLITNHYFATVTHGEYTLIDHPVGSKLYNLILWSDSTLTQCVVDVYGDDSTIGFVDSDDEFQLHIAKLVGIAEDWVATDRLKTVIIDDLYTDIYGG